MKIDLHCHSKYSHDTYFEPEHLIQTAIDKGLDGVCFTEHYSVQASKEVEQIKVPDGFYVFRGVEIATSWGHMLAYGLKDDAWNQWDRNNYLDARKVIKSIHALGGICVPAHPFRDEQNTHLTQGVFYGMLRVCVFVASIFQAPLLNGFTTRSNLSP